MNAISIEMFETRIKSLNQAKEYFLNACKLVLFDDKPFNSKFILEVLKENKNLIPMSSYANLDLERMKHIKIYDRQNLFNIIRNDENMMKFIPNNSKCKDFSRNTLLNVSMNISF